MVRVFFTSTRCPTARGPTTCSHRQGRPMAALEAKRASTAPGTAAPKGCHYAELGVPFVFLSNGEEVRFLDRETDAHPRRIAGFYSQDDWERRIAARRIRRDLAAVAIDRKFIDRDYQIGVRGGAVRRDWAWTPQAPRRNGDRHRQDLDGCGSGQAPFRSRDGNPRPVSGGPDRLDRTGRGWVHRPSSGLPLPCLAIQAGIRPHQARHESRRCRP